MSLYTFILRFPLNTHLNVMFIAALYTVTGGRLCRPFTKEISGLPSLKHFIRIYARHVYLSHFSLRVLSIDSHKDFSIIIHQFGPSLLLSIQAGAESAATTLSEMSSFRR